MNKVDNDGRCRSLGPRSVRCVLADGHVGHHEAYYFSWETNSDHRDSEGARHTPTGVSLEHEQSGRQLQDRQGS